MKRLISLTDHKAYFLRAVFFAVFLACFGGGLTIIKPLIASFGFNGYRLIGTAFFG